MTNKNKNQGRMKVKKKKIKNIYLNNTTDFITKRIIRTKITKSLNKRN